MENLAEKVISIIALNRGKSITDLNENIDLVNDLAFDSLDKVELIMEFENKFSVHISDDEAEKIKTISDIVKFLEKNIK